MSANWESCRNDDQGLVERMEVPGGWLYKVRLSIFGAQGWPVETVSVTFVPAPPPTGRSGVLRGYEIQDEKPAPAASVEVTENAMVAAIEAYEVACPRPHVPSHAGLKAAIEAAISEMGLR